MNKKITMNVTAVAFASLALMFAAGSAQAGWGQNGMYGNAPQPKPGVSGYGGNGPVIAGRPPIMNPGQRPVWTPSGPHPTNVQIYPRPAPPVYVPTPVVVRPPVYVPTPVVVRQPVYVPAPVVVRQPVYVAPPVRETVYVRPAPVVAASTPAPVTPAPVVNNNCNCLVKEYPQAGVVVFKDICTKESATYSNLPQQTTEVVPTPSQ
jgi:hypothetical protein